MNEPRDNRYDTLLMATLSEIQEQLRAMASQEREDNARIHERIDTLEAASRVSQDVVTQNIKRLDERVTVMQTKFALISGLASLGGGAFVVAAYKALGSFLAKG